jgi:hypothetical protein
MLIIILTDGAKQHGKLLQQIRLEHTYTYLRILLSKLHNILFYWTKREPQELREDKTLRKGEKATSICT